MAYLDDHPPARSQMRCPRRATPSGVIVVHTGESILDLVGGDHGAENLAYFIAMRRDAPGSYHEIADSDSFVQVVRWTCEAFQDGTGSNPHAMGLSFALRAADWPKMTPDRVERFLRNGVARAVAYARWVRAEYGVVIPARRLSRAESEQRRPGFISHGDRDPARRTDPGAGFPWARFLSLYASAMGEQPTPPPEDDDVQQSIVFYSPPPGAPGTNEAYLVTNNIGKHLPTKEAVATAEYLGVKRANQPDKPWGKPLQDCAVLVDGPCRNTP